jgi:hypothetical protein
MNCLLSFGRWDHGFESQLGHGCLVCMCVYSVFVLSCVQVAALRRADHSSKESYRLYRSRRKNENLDTVRVRYNRNGYKQIFNYSLRLNAKYDFAGVTRLHYHSELYIGGEGYGYVFECDMFCIH